MACRATSNSSTSTVTGTVVLRLSNAAVPVPVPAPSAKPVRANSLTSRENARIDRPLPHTEPSNVCAVD